MSQTVAGAGGIGSAGGTALPATVTAALSTLSCAKATITGAGTDVCTVTLTAAAQSGGMAINLKTSDGTHVTVPAEVTVAAGATSATFTSTIAAAYTTHAVTVTASDNGVSKTYTINLVAPALSKLSCTKGTITGAGTDSCTVTLTAGAPSGGMAIVLASNDGTHVTLPATVTVATGAATASFTANAAAAYTTHIVTLTATYVGISKTYALDLVAPALSKLSCTKGTITGAGTDSCTVTLTAGAPSGGMGIGLTSTDGMHVTLPAKVTVSSGALTAAFTANVAASYTTHTVTLTGNYNGTSKTYAIDLVAPALSALSCTKGTMTGAGSDVCTVKVTAGAPSGGMAIGLASTDGTHFPVPASITVGAGATAASFTATVTAVNTTHTVTLTARDNGVEESFTVDLTVSAPGMTLGSTSVAFGDVTLNKPATQSVQITSSGAMPLTISLGTVSGTGFSMPGVTFPITLNPGASMQLELQFDPKTAGSSSGIATLTTNAPSGTAQIGLSGTGVTAAYIVNLTWDAPTSTTDPVAGYDVYRAVSGSSSYQQLNSGLVGATSFGDTTVQAGTTYVYYVVSVDSAGNQSAPSNRFNAVVP